MHDWVLENFLKLRAYSKSLHECRSDASFAPDAFSVDEEHSQLLLLKGLACLRLSLQALLAPMGPQSCTHPVLREPIWFS
jgi:D-serine dehydratase